MIKKNDLQIPGIHFQSHVPVIFSTLFVKKCILLLFSSHCPSFVNTKLFIFPGHTGFLLTLMYLFFLCFLSWKETGLGYDEENKKGIILPYTIQYHPFLALYSKGHDL